jgi:hypothetical protein
MTVCWPTTVYVWDNSTWPRGGNAKTCVGVLSPHDTDKINVPVAFGSVAVPLRVAADPSATRGVMERFGNFAMK